MHIAQSLWGNAINQKTSLRRLRRGGLSLLVLMTILASMFVGTWQAEAQGAINLVSSSVTSEFPDGIRYKAEVTSSQEITEIRVRFRKGSSSTSSYNYLEFDKGNSVSGEFFFRTDTAGSYMPPGTPVTYHFEIEDADGNKLVTEPEVFIYEDTRFEWKEVTGGPITVAYHGPVETRAELIIDAMMETLDNMGPLLGADTSETIRVNMYNNPVEMLKALPPRSQTIRTELVTEGMAFADIGMLLVLGSGTLAKGTASHELTHILVHRATEDTFRPVPAWLNEGLAEYGNIDPSFSYDLALEFAIATGRLQPILFLDTQPGTPEDVIIFYGQGSSIVTFLVDSFGGDKLRQFFAELNGGKSIDDAFIAIYGFDRSGLDRQWRDSIGAPPYVPPAESGPRPTPPPLPTFLPYSLTPQPASEPSPTATPQPVDTPTPVPSPQTTSTPAPSGGGGCSAPLHAGGRVPVDPSLAAIVVGIVGLGWASRRKRK